MAPTGRTKSPSDSAKSFPAGTLVITSGGSKAIEDIEVGELVLTHRGRWREVLRTQTATGNTVRIVGYGHFGLVTTPAQTFYSKRITTRYPGKDRATGKRPGWKRELVENPYWPEAVHLEGKLWATPRRIDALPVPVDIGASVSDGLFYFIGRWLGDGTINKGDVEICTGIPDFPNLERILGREIPLLDSDGSPIPTRTRQLPTTLSLVWGCAPLARWLCRNFGSDTYSKQLPAWVYGLQMGWRSALLKGLMDSDGHFSGRRHELSSVSRALATDVKVLATTLGKSASLFWVKGRDGCIEGRSFSGADQYKVAWTQELKRTTSFSDSRHLFLPVRKVQPTGNIERVFNLQVRDDQSYVADGIVVRDVQEGASQ
jgi:hypothetical protein